LLLDLRQGSETNKIRPLAAGFKEGHPNTWDDDFQLKDGFWMGLKNMLTTNDSDAAVLETKGRNGEALEQIEKAQTMDFFRTYPYGSYGSSSNLTLPPKIDGLIMFMFNMLILNMTCHLCFWSPQPCGSSD